ncbi:hypothetical protein [Nostoc sp. CENA543]|uniref:hypothetical protein n=1 Tax=Nostoc sp. CENA543 TaxID=1869241 RepID=UPI00130014B9|nr:hypothetical protein [Nostoc sp. CENA543]
MRQYVVAWLSLPFDATITANYLDMVNTQLLSVNPTYCASLQIPLCCLLMVRGGGLEGEYGAYFYMKLIERTHNKFHSKH